MTAVLSRELQAAVTQYHIVWKSWPKLIGAAGRHSPIGIELELVGCHSPNLNHGDPACAECGRVRSVLLAIADALIQQTVFGSREMGYEIKSNANSIPCSLAVAQCPLISVTIHIICSAERKPFDKARVLHDIKRCLASCGIHQH